MKENIKQIKLPIIVASIYLILLIVKSELALEAFNNSLYYLREMVEILPVIFMLMIAIEVLVPREWIIKRFGAKSGISGNVLSLVFGSISAGPIYAAFPITKMLLNKGASVGNVVIVLSAWAVVKVPMLANEAKFLGPQFMVARWLLTVLMIFLMGWVMEKTVKKSEVLQSVEGDISDASNELGVLSINESYCIGCGVCTRMAPELYEMKEKIAVVKQSIDYKAMRQEQKDTIKATVIKCPVAAIDYGHEV